MYPSYLEAYTNGRLNKKIEEAFSLLESCSLCPRKCGINRMGDEKGFCQTGKLARVFSFMPHYGEEPVISGLRGSGTIFFSGCNMACVYCQNYEFSQTSKGTEVDPVTLAKFMIKLQELKCHNINLVTPTHVMPQILKALSIAISRGLRLPLVYNTGGYELPEVIRLLEGIVDIFLPDMRYADNEAALRYSNAKNYPEYNQAALREMYKQVGTAQIDEQDLIKRGLIIRHLVLPNNIAATRKIMRFIAQKISPQTYISLMSQYFPCYKAAQFPELSRRISEEEYKTAEEAMLETGLQNGWIQQGRGLECFAGTNIKPKI
ncbi:MAG: 4Fe-4S cluster-binding domain-containing protein [Candidatus Omnitrophica bacterium]|nr:4Fe-4S cluster-binding domain-containing protein [Candidatus Omnitrophota bacterium]